MCFRTHFNKTSWVNYSIRWITQQQILKIDKNNLKTVFSHLGHVPEIMGPVFPEEKKEAPAGCSFLGSEFIK